MKPLSPLLLCLVALPAFADGNFCGTDKPHPIDVEAGKRMETAMTTVDIRDAQGQAYQAWDKELNRIYRELMRGLDKDSAAKLKKAQKAWIAFRDSEVDWLWSKAIYGDAGTSGPVNVSGADTEMVRQRVCELTKSLQARNVSAN